MGAGEQTGGCGCGRDHAHEHAHDHECACGHDHAHDSARDAGALIRREVIELVPRVGMRYLMAMPHVCTIGVADALLAAGLADAALGWPWQVVMASTETELARITTHSGYADGKVRIACVVDLAPACDSVRVDQLREGLLTRLEMWEAAVEAGHAAAGPVAPILSEMFDRTPLLGHEVEVLRADGTLAAVGTFAGLDVWGRAMIVCDGEELVVAPDRARLRAI